MDEAYRELDSHLEIGREAELIIQALQNSFDAHVDVESFERLSGGLTNSNFKVRLSDQSVVVRLSSETSSLLSIDRDREYQNSLLAAEVGVGVPVLGRSLEPLALVVRYVDGKTLSSSDLRDGNYLEVVIDACKKLHGARPFIGKFNMFDIQRNYLNIVESRGYRVPPDYLEYMGKVERLRQAMLVFPEAPVPCNNDLLAENFIDGGDRIWIIDYEYSGNNEPSFELGNIWSESNLSTEQLELIVSRYYGTLLASKVARLRLWGLMSKYGWTLWAAIQENIASIDFDFWSWGMEKYERALEEFSEPGFSRLLAEVTETK